MQESINIELNSGSKSILKIGFLIRACFILFFVIGTALFGLYIFKVSIIIAIVCLIITFIMFRIFFKMLNAAFYKEYLIVTKESITVVLKNLSSTKKNVFKLNTINYFGFANQYYTKHPLDNQIIDFTGLAAREKELQYVIDDGNIKIETGTKSIKFGKNMPSWDVEELVEKIELFTGRKFVIPKHENSVDEIALDDELIVNNEIERSAAQTTFEKHTYIGDFGELIIEQKKDIPGTEDIAFLNGTIAPTGKYQIGDKQFVLVSNGLIYAVRGFNDEKS